MKTLARVAAILLAALSVAGVALALQAAFGFGQSGANFGERAGNVAGQRVERFMSAAEAQLELEGASDQSTARGPRQRLTAKVAVIFWVPSAACASWAELWLR